MVNGINGNEPYDYTQLKMPNAADRTGGGEQFSLAYQRAQEETEEKDKSDKAEESDAKGTGAPRTVMQGGVKLELSAAGQKSADAGKDGSKQAVGQGLIDTVRSWIAVFTRSLKDFFYNIWNDPASQSDTGAQEKAVVSDEEGESAEPERLTEEYIALKNLETLQDPEIAARKQIEHEKEREKEIHRLLRSGNMERVISLVTENGQKTMAKNSTLLTYYDRTGKIMSPNASDQERILHGDRNVKKL